MLDLANDLDVLSATLWGEARGEGREGIAAVASVIANRVSAGGHFGHGFAGICLKPWQFSCWNTSDPNRERLLGLDIASPRTPELNLCVNVAREALAGILVDTTHGALYYKVSTLAWPHDWGTPTEPLATIGHHSFYRLVE